MRRYGSKPARESATRRFCATTLAVCLTLYPYSAAMAGGPTGGSVAAGSATITNPTANTTTINQTSEKVIINWQNFSIPSDASVFFNQPDAKAIALNRVTGTGASAIDGALTANGNIWIINPNGILFGQGSSINVGSLIATTSDISDSDFMNGQYNFTKAGNPNASVSNEGTIKAANGGSIVLAGPVVSNGGLIEADLGTVTLAGTEAFTVDFQGDNLIRFTMAAPETSANPQQLAVSNSGKISANGGHVVMTVRAAQSVASSVINNTGMVEANSVHNENGTIVLDAGDGQANVSGTLDASGKDAGQTGGSVSVTGNAVNVADNTKIDASGSAGGGTIAIGGNPHGAGPMPNAQDTTVGKATLSADATDSGNGGTISVWSDKSTQFSGSASARGAGTGNGGFIETSGGTLNIADGAHVDASAPKGHAGTWLIDPAVTNISIANSGGTISPATIESELGTNSSDGTNVTLSTSGGSITVYDPITYTSANTLNLLAGADIYAAADIQNGGTGNINLIAGWDGTTTDPALFGHSGVYGNNNGSVYVTSDYDLDPDEAYNSEAEEGEAQEVAIGSAGGITTVGGYGVEVLGAFGPSQIGYRGAGGGGVDIYAVGDVTLTGGSCSYCYAQIGSGGIGYNGESATFTNGNASGDVSLHAGGDVTLTSGSSVYSYAQIGNGGDTSTGNANGDVLVDAGGAVNLQGAGDYAQIGNGGWAVNGNSSGTVTVNASGDITLTGGSSSAYGYTQIGNGGQSSHGNSSGDVYVQSGGAITLASEANSENYALIGNGGYANIGNSVSGNASGSVMVWAEDNLQFDVCGGENCSTQGTVWVGNAAPSGVVSGDLTIIAADQKDNCGNNDCNANVGAMVVSALGDDANGNYIAGAGGNVTVAYTDPQHNDAPQLKIDANISYDSPFDLAIISGNNIYVPGSLQNAGTGDITLVSGWNASLVTPGNIITQAGADASMAALFAANPAAYGANDGTILIGGTNACQDAEGPCGSAVGSAGGTTSVFAGDVTVEADNGTARIGYHGAGGGAINVFATNDVNVTGNDGQHAVIGNGGGDIAANVTGDIDIQAGNQLQLYANNNGTAWIGNAAHTGHVETGNVSVIAGSEDDNFDVSAIILSDLGDDQNGNYIAGAGGNVTFGFTSLAGDMPPGGGGEYNSPHTLSILANTGQSFTGSLLNDGTGAINIVAGWNPAVVTPNQVVAATNGADGAMAALFVANPNGYGNNGGSVTIGGKQLLEDPSVGSAGGTTTVFTSSLTLNAGSDVAQLGHPDGNGDIAVYAKGTIALTGNSADALAIIGNGTTSAPGGGNISLVAQAMTVNAYNAVLGDAATITVTGTNGIGDTADPLRLWLNSIAITTAGGGVVATSPGGGISIGVGSNGINLDGGALTLSAAGAISQTQAILASAIDVSTTSGAITLSNSSNSFGTLTVATSGSDDATIYDSSAVTVASANVGGTFTLTSGGAIGQSGAIAANTFNVSSTGGAITLANAGNSFGTLTVSTSGSNDANVNDSAAVTVASAHVGGTFTLSSGGAIAQSGVVVADALNVSSTGGTITLTNSGNSFGSLSASTNGSNDANIHDSTGVSVTSAHVGGTFTLSSTGAIGQSGAIVANTFNVSSTGGAITLNNAGNSFGTLTVTTSASNNASLNDSAAVTVASANVGGTFTLTSGGAIGQSGAISADALDVSSTGGDITLGNSANAFGTLSAVTTGSHNASINDTSAVTVASANVGGTFTLSSAGTIGQSGSIVAGAVDVSSTGGAITLTNSGNQFATLSVSTSANHDANINDSTAVTVASATVGGTLTLSSGGAIGQSGAITANALNVSSTGGAITLTNSSNVFASVTANTGANNDANIYDSTGVSVTSANVGGTFTVASGGSIGQSGAIMANGLDVSSTGGPISLSDAANAFGTLSVTTSGNNNANFNDSTALTIASAHVGGALTLTAGGALGQSGAVVANALNASTLSGPITLTNPGNTFATLSVATAGSSDAAVTDSASVTIASAHVGGTFTLASGGSIGQNDPIIANALNVSSTGGAITLDDPGNAFNTITIAAGANSATVYDTASLVVAGAAADGGLTLLSKGNLTFVSSVQVANGNLLAVAGWDGTTVSPASLVAGNAYGNNNGSIVIGGAGASGGVAVGASGTATLAGDDITLAATNGYAQLGTHGSGAGTLAVTAKGNVALNAGSAPGSYAQIGNGGYQTSGSNGGAIAVTAAGGVTLAGGSGGDAYAQIGHGGAESNASSSGYSDNGAIAVNAASVTLSSGGGSAAYAQIGNGGYRTGAGLTGTATIGGAIAVTSTSAVNINGGGGSNAYAQIGNGGGFINTNATASAHGTTSGDVIVTAPPGSGAVNVVAGAGVNAYAQIGNGGYSSNSPSAAPHANFTITGNVTVSDLLLQGGNVGAFAYSQIGNGGLGNSGLADVSGNIDIITNGGTITLVPGTAQGSSTEIGNDIGTGAVSGSITGYVPPLSEANGTIATLTSTPPTVPTDETTNTLLIEEQQTQTVTTTPETGNEPGPLEDLTGNSGSGEQESSDKSDKAADAVADSLDGAAKKSASEVYFGGLVTKLQPVPASAVPHGVPPADADFSSWGNEAFWQ
mgnify:FL=1